MSQSPLYPTRVRVPRPSVPKPTATAEEIREFFIQFILSQNTQISQEGAAQEANKLPADGESFYGLSEGELRQEFGHIGGAIFRARQESEYGYVSRSSQSLTRRFY